MNSTNTDKLSSSASSSSKLSFSTESAKQIVTKLFSLAPTRNELLLTIPLIVWLFFFQFFTFIPIEYRPVIDVETLPLVEKTFFGTDLLYKIQPPNDVLIMVAAIPYLIHFILPWFYAAYLWYINGRPGVAFVFLWCIGTLNLLAVLTQVLFPTAPPWYNAKYGSEPANYDMKGNPGRFKIADSLLNMKLFEGLYGQSPIVFGSFPSLHAAWPFLIAAFATQLSLSFTRLKWVYMTWVWWAAMYSKHHFFIDLLGGAIYAAFTLYIADRLLANHLTPSKPSTSDPNAILLKKATGADAAKRRRKVQEV